MSSGKKGRSRCAKVIEKENGPRGRKAGKTRAAYLAGGGSWDAFHCGVQIGISTSGEVL